MEVHICEFCGTEFSALSNLITHKRTAKYCLKLREVPLQIYTCDVCERTFSSSASLKRHTTTCSKRVKELEELLQDAYTTIVFQKRKLETTEKKLAETLADRGKEIESLSQKIEVAKLSVYKDEYLTIRDRPTTTTTTTNTTNKNVTTAKLNSVNISTIEPFTLDLVKKRLEENAYTYEMFLMGEPGLNEFILSLIVKDDEKNYLSTDNSRANFHRLNEARKWILDVKALFLTKVFAELKPIIHTYLDRYHEEVPTHKITDTKTEKEYASFHDTRDVFDPMATMLISNNDEKRKPLLKSVVEYIKPHIAV
jgi:hypothetical protein